MDRGPRAADRPRRLSARKRRFPGAV